jgi:hypothetical protein
VVAGLWESHVASAALQRAADAGMSRRYGGIHFARADMAGRLLGQLVAEKVWQRAQEYFSGSFTPKPAPADSQMRAELQ